MATLSNRVFYQGGVATEDSPVVGFESKRTRVVRYNLNLDSGEQASHISVVFAEDPYEIHVNYGNSLYHFTNNLNGSLSFYFAISTDPGAFVDAGYADISRSNGKAVFTQVAGYTCDENMEYKVSCETDILLYPGIQYYFWVFPGFSNDVGGNDTWGWVYWHDVSTKVTLSGHAGIAWIKTDAGFKPTVPYVRQAGEWKHALPYVRKNNAWNIGTGQ